MKNELKKIESNIYMKYFGDGLWDIFIGLVFLNFGLGILLDLPYLAGITAPLAYMGIKQIKTKITVPRIGYIQFKQTRKRLVALILAGMLLLGMIFFTIFMMNRESPLVGTSCPFAKIFCLQRFGGSLSGLYQSHRIVGFEYCSNWRINNTYWMYCALSVH